MTRFRSTFLALFVALLFSLSTSPAQAQEWRQELQVITTIPYNSSLHVFLDSLASFYGRNPELSTRRSLTDHRSVPYRVLRDSLYEEGVDLRSASHVLIRYQFSSEGNGMVETIKDLYFIFRFDESTSDLPILYLNTQNPVVSDLLTQHGIPSPMNMESVTPFRKLFTFPTVYADSQTEIVELGRKALRNDLSDRHQMLVDIINQQTAFGSGGYTLSTTYQNTQARDSIASPRVAADSSLFR